MENKMSVFTTFAFCSFFSACSVGPVPGKMYGKTPPQIVIQELEKQGDRFVGGFVWDHPEYFGPVPEEKKAEGSKVCQSIKARKAIGYHPQAKDVNGISLKNGGYYCVK